MSLTVKQMEKQVRTMALQEDSTLEISDDAFETISRLLKGQRGFNLGCYKDKCIRRRINIRIRATHCKNADEYCELLVASETELDLLLKVLTIHVSQFFRNYLTFQKLEEEIFPQLISRCKRRKTPQLRIWSVGCASGEEPYTLALILQVHFQSEIQGIDVTILATDVDSATLEVAAAGIYGEDRLAEAPIAIKERYFQYKQNKYHLQPKIKEMVTFRQADLHDIDSYVESDLILCRNVLIYFERSQQQKILEGFADALSPGGFLVLGKSETLFGPPRERFSTICPVERIYQANDKGNPQFQIGS